VTGLEVLDGEFDLNTMAEDEVETGSQQVGVMAHESGDKTTIYDVIIVGAGLAGLSAAECLLDRDPSMSVLCLEASDRVGGRVQALEVGIANAANTKSDPVLKDVGGEWLLPERHTSLMQLMDRLGLRTFSPPAPPLDNQDPAPKLRRLTQIGKRAKVKNSGAVSALKMCLSSWETSHVLWKLDGIMSTVCLEDPFWSTPGAALLDATTVKTFLERTCYVQYTKDLMAIKLRFLTGHDPDSVSLLFLLFYAKSSGAATFTHFFNDTQPRKGDAIASGGSAEPLAVTRVSSGAHDICRRLASNALPQGVVNLNQPVISVIQSPSEQIKAGQCTVTTMNGQSFQGKRVIVAVPPSVITGRGMEFHPPLAPFKKQALANSIMGSYTKFILTYDEAYWLDSGFSGDFLSNGGLQTKAQMEGSTPVTLLMDGTTSDGVPTLVGYLGGRQSVQWASQGEDALRTAVLDSLSTLFGGTWVREPCDFVLKNWNEDSFAGGGSVAAPIPGKMHAFHALREPAGLIHFAGTETAVENYGTMCGAVESGQRAAIEALEELKPQCLSSRDMALLCRRPTKLHKSSSNNLVSRLPGEPVMYSNVFRWTIVMPCLGIGAALLAVQMRNKYSQLFRPHF